MAGNSVVVQACAGAGKTTLALQCVRALGEGSRTLLLTYNKGLKTDTRKKIRALGLGALCECHSFHAFGCRHFDPGTCHVDDGLADVVRADRPPSTPYAYDLIVVDEVQDMRPLFFAFVMHISRHNSKRTQNSSHHQHHRYMLVGDPQQTIYGFMGADFRFLTMAPRIFSNAGGAPGSWTARSLRLTWRLTQEMCAAVACFVGPENGPQSLRSNAKKVRYVACNPYGQGFGFGPYSIIMDWLEAGHRPRDIMVLVPSVRGLASPARALVDKLLASRVPVSVPTSDEEVLDERVVRGKLQFGTFHQVKGGERPCVLVFSMDASYFQYYARGEDPTKCPNAVYVALTRAREELVLIQDAKQEPFAFLDMARLATVADVELQEVPASKKEKVKSDEKKTMATSTLTAYQVTDLIRHLPYELEKELISGVRITVQNSSDPTQTIDLEKFVRTSGYFYEGVSEINGVTIPAMYELRRTGTCSIHEHLSTSKRAQKYKEELSALLADGGIGAMLRMATLYCASLSGYDVKPVQIKSYDWLSEPDLARCFAVLDAAIGHGDDATNKMVFEAPLSVDVDASNKKSFRIRGSMDLLLSTNDDDGDVENPKQKKIYEFKCASTLQVSHVLQCVLYGYLLHGCKLDFAGDEVREKVAEIQVELVYVTSDKHYRVSFDPATGQSILDKLLLHKSSDRPTIMSDVDFETSMSAI